MKNKVQIDRKERKTKEKKQIPETGNRNLNIHSWNPRKREDSLQIK